MSSTTMLGEALVASTPTIRGVRNFTERVGAGEWPRTTSLLAHGHGGD